MDMGDYQKGAASTWGKQHLPDDLYERLSELGVAADDISAIRRQGERLTLGVLGLGLSGESGEVADEVKKFVGHGHWKESFNAEKEIGDVLWYAATLATALDLDLNVIAAKNLAKLGIGRYANGFSTEASQNRDNELSEEELDARSARALQFRSQEPNSLKLTTANEVYNLLSLLREAGALIHPADDPAKPSKGWVVRYPPDTDRNHLHIEITLSDFRNSSDPRTKPSKAQWDALLSPADRDCNRIGDVWAGPEEHVYIVTHHNTKVRTVACDCGFPAPLELVEGVERVGDH